MVRGGEKLEPSKEAARKLARDGVGLDQMVAVEVVRSGEVLGEL